MIDIDRDEISLMLLAESWAYRFGHAAAAHPLDIVSDILRSAEQECIVPPGSVDYESFKYDDPRDLPTDKTGGKCPRCLTGHICGSLFTVGEAAKCDHCAQRFLITGVEKSGMRGGPIVAPEGYSFEFIYPGMGLDIDEAIQRYQDRIREQYCIPRRIDSLAPVIKCNREHRTEAEPIYCGLDQGHVGDCSSGPKRRLGIAPHIIKDITAAVTNARNAVCTCGTKHVGGEHSDWCDSRRG